MKKIVLAAVAVGVLAIGGGAFAFAQGQESGDVTIEVIGGPEGSRSFTKPMNESALVTFTQDAEYTLNFYRGGKQVESSRMTKVRGAYDCYGDDSQGEPMYGCVVAPE